jgi:putative PIN family toxin of toxin-antitoxin system
LKLLIDTNILISAGLFPKSVPAKALQKALVPPHSVYISDYSVDEATRVARLKFPAKVKDLYAFLFKLLLSVNFVESPPAEYERESKIRDIKDRPILRAALSANVDAILTGDKDFLEADVDKPQMITAAQFLQV